MAGRTPEPDDDREPTPDAEDIDVRFAEITASLGDLTVPPAESVHGPSEETPEEGQPASSVPPVPSAPPVPGPRDFELGPEVDDNEPGFVPPEPPALAGAEPLLALAWAGVVVPVALVLVYLVAWRGMPTALLGLAGVVFLASVGVLIWRMPGRREPDDHDDGAVV